MQQNTNLYLAGEQAAPRLEEWPFLAASPEGEKPLFRGTITRRGLLGEQADDRWCRGGLARVAGRALGVGETVNRDGSLFWGGP